MEVATANAALEEERSVFNAQTLQGTSDKVIPKQGSDT